MLDLKTITGGLRERWGKAQWQRNRIDRQKNMIDPNSIVLYTEFHTKAIEPAAQSHSAFRDVFADGRGISNALYGMMLTGYAPMFPVPLEAVDDSRVKESYLESLRMQIDMGNQMLDMITTNLGGPDKVVIVGDGLTGDPDADFDKARKEAIVPGFYVYHLALAMDLHRTLLGGTGIQRYESKALWRDQGQHVVGFWEGVNGLKDYSGYFPDRKPPRGNDPDDRNGRSPVGQFEPVF